MKEMEYCTPNEFGKREILMHGTYNDYEVCIMSYFTHPCAYVKLHENEKINTDAIECHGGITYDCDGLIINNSLKTIAGHWIGWDYAHSGDYYADLPRLGGKQWTTAEILAEIKSVVNQLKEVVR